MFSKPSNLVFEGGGVFGIAYLGVLQYLHEHGLLQSINRVAGTSAGAITACITSFNLPFEETKDIVNTLDYKKVPEKDVHPDLRTMPRFLLNEFNKVFDDFDCVYRLIKNYGWYSSDYFYNWIKTQIGAQFDSSKKQPPYTFADFKNTSIHNQQRSFYDLYIIGTDLTNKTSKTFCYETTPNMEVAEAVRISMSIPLFFEAIKRKDDASTIFCDGGVLWNYPVEIFDSDSFKDHNMPGANYQTIGARFVSKIKYYDITNIINYVRNLYLTQLHIQQDDFNRSPRDIARSIQIDTGDISPIDFNISTGDEKYQFLYTQGYKAAQSYFENHIYL